MWGHLESAKLVFETLAYVVTVLGLPWAAALYFKDARQQRMEREIGTYKSLSDTYHRYLELCLEHPSLNAYAFCVHRDAEFTPAERVQRYAIFEMLVSVMERAHLLYADHSDAKRQAEWSGWEQFIADWKSRPDWTELWAACGYQYESAFTNYVNTLPPSGKLIAPFAGGLKSSQPA